MEADCQKRGPNPCKLFRITEVCTLVAGLATHGTKIEEVGCYAYVAQARARARRDIPGLYEIYATRTRQLVQRFEVCVGGELIYLWPEPEPAEPMIAALFAA